MPVEKKILNGSVLKLNPGGVGGTELDLSGLIRNASVQPKRVSVATGAHGDLADTFGKGSGQHQLVIDLMYPNSLSAVMPALIAEFNQQEPTGFSLKLSSAPTGVDNPEITGEVSIHDLGNFGGARNEVMTMSVTLPISGQISYNNGATTVTL
jgi:hypothetical protein